MAVLQLDRYTTNAIVRKIDLLPVALHERYSGAQTREYGDTFIVRRGQRKVNGSSGLTCKGTANTCRDHEGIFESAGGDCGSNFLKSLRVFDNFPAEGVRTSDLPKNSPVADPRATT